jgi:uncharacterized protein (TIGR03435 family)
MTATVRNLVMFAYSVRDIQVSGGPHWTDTDAFNIQAEATGHPTNAELKLMVQSLLASRFGLKFHRESKEQPVYDLVVDKKGAKLTAVDKAGIGVGFGGPLLIGRGADMATLASTLSAPLGRIVRDKTALPGFFDFRLTWTPDDAKSDDPGPTLFTALQEQLGLKLEPARGPVEMVVIDAVEHPSAN